MILLGEKLPLNSRKKMTQSDPDDPWDKAVSELVDMGFSVENSRRALTESGSGLDIQAAVGWLLNDAHRQAKQKAQGNRATAKDPERENRSKSNARDTSVDLRLRILCGKHPRKRFKRQFRSFPKTLIPVSQNGCAMYRLKENSQERDGVSRKLSTVEGKEAILQMSLMRP